MNRDRDVIDALDAQDVTASLQQDHETLLSLWDDEGVALPPGAPPVRGKAALRDWLVAEGEPDYDVTEYVHEFSERRILGDWAFEWGTFISAAAPHGEGAPIRSTGKLLRILRRQEDGGWKVSHAIWNLDPLEE